MAMYAGIDGVSRKLDHFDVGIYGSVYHLPILQANIDGVARNLLELTDQIDRFEVEIQNVYTETYDSSNQSWSYDEGGNTLAAARQIGSISVGSNYVQVSCTTYGRGITIYGHGYIVFKDGHREELYPNYGILSDPKNTFSLYCYDYEYFRNEGSYIVHCFGNPLYSQYVYNSHSGYTYVTDIKDSWAAYIFAGRVQSGTTTVQIQYNSLTINGKSIPVKVVNKLT